MLHEIDRLTLEMTEYFSGDPKRIQHFVKVHEFARLIGRCEGLDIKTMYILDTASVVHDIGIKEAEQLYGKGVCGGDLQQQLGPEPARKMLTELDFDSEVIDRVCFLIAHHHTYTGVKGMDWQILLEADFIVNAYEDGLDKNSVRTFRDKVFRTQSGTKLLNDIFGLET